MNLITATEIMEQIQLLSESPANSKNERAFCLRDIRDCAVRLLEGEAVPVDRDIEIERLSGTLPAGGRLLDSAVCSAGGGRELHHTCQWCDERSAFVKGRKA